MDANLIPDRIQTAMVQYIEKKRELDRLSAEVKKLKATIADHVLETEDTSSVPGLSLSIKAAHKRISWETEKLQGFAVAHPKVLKFMKETTVKASVSFTLKTK